LKCIPRRSFVRRLPRVLVALEAIVFLFALNYACFGEDLKATLLSPSKGQQVTGAKVEIAIGYNSGSNDSVTRMDLLVDGSQVGSKVMDSPRKRGVASFLWDSRQSPNGAHKFEVNIYSGGKLLGSVSGSVKSSNKNGDYHPPTVKFENLTSGSLSGSRDVKVSVSGVGDKPIVGVLVDKTVKGIKNHPPYSFTVDTKELTDGRHIVEAYALDDIGNRTDAQPVEILVGAKAGSVVASAPPVKPTGKAVVEVVEKKPVAGSKGHVAKPSAKNTTVLTAKAATPITSKKPVVATAKTPVVATSKPVVAASKTSVVVSAKTPAATTAKTSVVVTTKTPVVASAKTPVATAKKTSVVATAKTPAVATAKTSVVTAQKPPIATTAKASVVVTTKTPAVTAVKTPVVATAKIPAVVTSKTPAPPLTKKSGASTASVTSPPVRVASLPAGNTTPKPVVNNSPPAKSPKPTMTTGKTASAPALTAKPAVPAKAQAKQTHRTLPQLKTAWAPPVAKKIDVAIPTAVAFVEPKPEIQASAPHIAPKPARPAVVRVAAVPQVPASTSPTISMPSVPRPEVAPKARPIVAAVKTPEPVKPAKAPAKAPKPENVARVSEPVLASDVFPIAEPQQQPKKMIEVSLRWALLMAGLNVTFANDGQVITASDGKKKMEFQVGAREVLMDDHVVLLPSPITTVEGRVMIPLSFIVEQLGLALKDPRLTHPQSK
jgi:hypothetical protein